MHCILSAPSAAINVDDRCCAGFFYVKNHGVPQDLIDREFEVNSRYSQSAASLTLLLYAPSRFEPNFRLSYDARSAGILSCQRR